MVNSIVFQGRLVADIEVKRTQSDVAYSEFTIAWSEKYKEAETKCFLRCKAWRNTAEFLEKYFRKGQEIVIEGHLVTDQWQKDGQNQSRTICQIDKVHFCGSKSNNNDSSGTQDGSAKQEADKDGFMNIPDDIDEELPFN